MPNRRPKSHVSFRLVNVVAKGERWSEHFRTLFASTTTRSSRCQEPEPEPEVKAEPKQLKPEVKVPQSFVKLDSSEMVSPSLFVPSSFLFLVVRPGAPSSVLVPSSDALCS